MDIIYDINKRLAQKKKRQFLTPKELKKVGGFRKLYKELMKLYHYNITGEIIDIDITNNTEKLKFLFEWITGKKGNKGVYLFGNYGTGKTGTLFSLKEMLRYFKKENAVFMTANAIVDNYRLLYDDIIEFNRFRNAKLMIIDDFGSDGNVEIVIYGNRVKPLSDLIEFRYRHGLWTWFTSNVHPSKLSEIYSGYIVDRLKEMVYFIEWNGKSFRK